MQLGQERNLAFMTAVVSLTVFYCAHWSTYCTGQLRFSRFDVTEAQMMVIGMLLATATFGPGMWSVAVGVLIIFEISKPLISHCRFSVSASALYSSTLASVSPYGRLEVTSR
jgi:ethanolaminephosphotransferase